ncbi:VCBS repeat-containing protein [bacterium]|nr:VCBS repeat-containing protein [bacterium]
MKKICLLAPILALLFCLVFCIEEIQAQQSCLKGTLPGEFEVDHLGQAHYDIPIVVPPATNGMQPQLSFHYSSMGGASHLGMGWQLSGLSAITRCNANRHQDGYIGSVHFDVQDRFCLDGQKLQLMTGIYGLQGSTYRTSVDSQSLIVAYDLGQGNTGPEHFMVYTKDGLVYEYGGNAIASNGRILTNGLSPAEVRVWALSRVYDRSGNFMKFTYGVSDGDYFPASIEYSGICAVQRNSSGLPINCIEERQPYNLIRFQHALGQSESLWVGGSYIRVKQLLSKVSIFAHGSAVGSYNLSYQSSPGIQTERPRLDAIKRCDQSGVCLSPTRFIWTDPATGSQSYDARNAGVWGTGFGGKTTVTKDTLVGDWSPDIGSALGTIALIQGATPIPIALPGFRSNGFSISASVGIGPVSVNFAYNRSKVLQDFLADFNGDGKTDAFQIHPTGGGSEVYVWLSDGTQFVSQGMWGIVDSIEDFRLGDFDGDGKTDIINFLYSSNSTQILYSTGSGFNTVFSSIAAGSAEDVIIADVNGDARSDVIEFEKKKEFGNYNPNKTKPKVWLSKDVGFNTTVIDFSSAYNFPRVDQIHLGDINGDGLSDVVTADPGNAFNTPEIKVYLSNGAQFSEIQTIYPGLHNSDLNKKTVTTLADVNGDRLADLLIFDPDMDTLGNIHNSPLDVFLSTGSIANAPYATTLVRDSSFDVSDTGFFYRTNVFTRPDFIGQIADINGDGKSDLVRFVQNATNDVEVQLSSANGFLPPIVWANGVAGHDEILIGDPDGDGRSDIISFHQDTNNSAEVWLSDMFLFPDRIASIFDGHGKRIDISYKPISDDSIYTGDTPLTSFDVLTRHQRGAFYVVESIGRSNGNDGMYSETHAYRGSKAHLSYGLLGFEEITTSDPQRQFSRIAKYNQLYPLTGTTASETLRTANLVNVLQDVHTWKTQSNTLNPQVKRVYLEKTVRNERELNSATISNVTTLNSYDAYNNILSIKRTTPTAYGETNTYTYLPADELSWTIGLHSSEVRSASVANGSSQSYSIFNTFDTQRRRLLSSTTTWMQNLNSMTLRIDYTYDSRGNILTEKISGTNISTRQMDTIYDAFGQFPTQSMNALGHIERYYFNSKFGVLDSTIDVNNQMTDNYYDTFSRYIGTLRPDGTITSIDYCYTPTLAEIPPLYSHSIVIRETGKPERRMHFDNLGRSLRSVKIGFDGTPIFVDNKFDGLMRLISTTVPYFQGQNTNVPAKIYQYDPIDRPAKITYPTGAISQFTYQAPAVVIANPVVGATTYGRTVRELRTGNRESISSYNDLGQLIQTHDVSSSNGTMLQMQSYSYDTYGNLFKTVDANGNITTATNDNLGYQLSLNDPDRGLNSYNYDALGQVMSSKDARGLITMYQYDLLGRLKIRSDASGVSQWTYDLAKKGTLSRLQGSNGYIAQYSYDTLTRPSAVLETIQGSNYTTSFAYDSSGRMSEITYPGAPLMKVAYGYNTFGYLARVYNPANNGNYWQLVKANERLQSGHFILGNNVEEKRTYHRSSGQVAGINTNKVGSTNFYQQLVYYYDNLSRLSAEYDIKNGYILSHQYDAIDRITHSTSCNFLYVCSAPKTYSYDKIGNILSKSDLGNYLYAPGAKPHAVKSITPYSGPQINFQYDLAGNTLSGNGKNYAWDPQGMPSRISDGVNDILISYNPDLKKIAVQDGLNTFRTHYVGKIYESTVNSLGSFQKRFVYVGDAIVATRFDTFVGITPQVTLLYHNTDRLGSITAVTNSSGNLVSGHKFDPFGQAVSSGISSNQRGFTGHEYYQNLKLIDMNARVYDPITARFASADTLVPDVTNSQSFNRYSYVNNSPTMFTDPSGHAQIPPDPIAFSGTSAVVDISANISAVNTFRGVDGMGFISVVNSANAAMRLNQDMQPLQTFKPIQGTLVAERDATNVSMIRNFRNGSDPLMIAKTELEMQQMFEDRKIVLNAAFWFFPEVKAVSMIDKSFTAINLLSTINKEDPTSSDLVDVGSSTKDLVTPYKPTDYSLTRKALSGVKSIVIDYGISQALELFKTPKSAAYNSKSNMLVAEPDATYVKPPVIFSLPMR